MYCINTSIFPVNANKLFKLHACFTPPNNMDEEISLWVLTNQLKIRRVPHAGLCPANSYKITKRIPFMRTYDLTVDVSCCFFLFCSFSPSVWHQWNNRNGKLLCFLPTTVHYLSLIWTFPATKCTKRQTLRGYHEKTCFSHSTFFNFLSWCFYGN